MNGIKARKNEYFYYDLAAALLGAVLFAFFFATARLGMPTVDEADYCNLRYLQGDIPFVEWWDPAQLFWLAMVPVVGLYKLLAGSADGLLLFMRYFFLAADAVFYAFMCRKLRRYRAAGLAGALTFCAVFPQTLRAVSYFTVSAFLFYGVCLLLLFGEKKRSPAALILFGALLAAGVMTEPFLLAVYIIYIGAVGARMLLQSKKRNLNGFAFVLEPRVCLWLTLGAFAVFLALVGFLAVKGTFSRLPEMLPYIFGGTKYTGASIFGDTKFRMALSFIGVVPAATAVLLAAASAALYFIKRPCRGARLALFALSCILAAYCWGRLFFGVFVTKQTDVVNAINYHGVLLQPFAVGWLLLSEKKDPRVSACLWAALLFGAAVDLGSSSVLGTGGTLAAFPGFVGFFSLAREAADTLKQAPQASDEPQKMKKAPKPLFFRAGSAAVLAAAALCTAGFLSWNAGFVGLETVDSPIERYISPMFAPGEAPYAETLEAGPCRGIVTSAKIASLYNGALRDLDEVKAAANGGPVMVYGFTPFAYLYLDLPYGSHGAWYDGDLDRAFAYWQKFPARRPACVYAPLFDNLYWASYKDLSFAVSREGFARKVLADLEGLGAFEAEFGESGVILRAIG